MSTVNSVNTNTNQSITADQIQQEIEEALNLIDALKSQGANDTQKETKQLLIDYILANTKGDRAEAQAIQDKLGQVLGNFQSAMSNANDIIGKLKELKANPGSNLSADQSYLSSLISGLNNDLQTGDMTNLSSFLNI